jgi:hypothetical protein
MVYLYGNCTGNLGEFWGTLQAPIYAVSEGEQYFGEPLKPYNPSIHTAGVASSKLASPTKKFPIKSST